MLVQECVINCLFCQVLLFLLSVGTLSFRSSLKFLSKISIHSMFTFVLTCESISMFGTFIYHYVFTFEQTLCSLVCVISISVIISVSMFISNARNGLI